MQNYKQQPIIEQDFFFFSKPHHFKGNIILSVGGFMILNI